MGDWAAALQGLGAGMQGQGAQFMAAQEMQKRTQLEQEQLRRQAVIQEGLMAESMIRNGRPDQALALFESRVEAGKSLPPMQSLGGNFDASAHVRDLLRSGDAAGALAELSAGNQILRDAGLLPKSATDGMASAKTRQFVDGTVQMVMPDGSVQVVLPNGQKVSGEDARTALQQAMANEVSYAGQKSGAMAGAQGQQRAAWAGPIAGNAAQAEAIVKGATEPQIAGDVQQAKSQAKAGVENSQGNRSNAIAFEVYRTGMDGVAKGLAGTSTGPVAGRLPAVTSGAQIAEGAVAAMAPILKQMFRASGEGTFTDKDQALLLDMIPERTDHPETVTAKIANINAIVNAKLQGTAAQGTSPSPSAPQSHPNEGKTAINPQTGQKIIMHNGQWVPM